MLHILVLEFWILHLNKRWLEEAESHCSSPSEMGTSSDWPVAGWSAASHHPFRLKTSWWMHTPVSCINTASDPTNSVLKITLWCTKQLCCDDAKVIHASSYATHLQLCYSALAPIPSGCAISDRFLQSNLSTPASTSSPSNLKRAGRRMAHFDPN